MHTMHGMMYLGTDVSDCADSWCGKGCASDRKQGACFRSDILMVSFQRVYAKGKNLRESGRCVIIGFL